MLTIQNLQNHMRRLSPAARTGTLGFHHFAWHLLGDLNNPRLAEFRGCVAIGSKDPAQQDLLVETAYTKKQLETNPELVEYGRLVCGLHREFVSQLHQNNGDAYLHWEIFDAIVTAAAQVISSDVSSWQSETALIKPPVHLERVERSEKPPQDLKVKKPAKKSSDKTPTKTPVEEVLSVYRRAMGDIDPKSTYYFEDLMKALSETARMLELHEGKIPHDFNPFGECIKNALRIYVTMNSDIMTEAEATLKFCEDFQVSEKELKSFLSGKSSCVPELIDGISRFFKMHSEELEESRSRFLVPYFIHYLVRSFPKNLTEVLTEFEKTMS